MRWTAGHVKINHAFGACGEMERADDAIPMLGAVRGLCRRSCAEQSRWIDQRLQRQPPEPERSTAENRTAGFTKTKFINVHMKWHGRPAHVLPLRLNHGRAARDTNYDRLIVSCKF